MQRDPHEAAHSLACTGNMRWLPEQLCLHWRGVIALLMPVLVVLAVTYGSKALPARYAPAVASSVPSPTFQTQQKMLRRETPPTSPSLEIHRSFEPTPSRGQHDIPLVDQIRRLAGAYAESHALVVGLSHYTGGWKPLPGVEGDVKAVTRALEKHGFHVVVVMDPTVSELEEAHRDFIGNYGFATDNRLLFYYAGSGYTAKPAYALNNQEDWMGYLVTRDAPLPTIDPDGFRRHALSMERFASLAREIQAKHALFLFDTCFSGAIAFAFDRSRLASPAAQTSPEVTSETADPVRQFIAAGTADQKAPDVSLFRRFLIEALEGDAEADRNGDGYVTGSELGQFLREKVTIASQGIQTPQYGKMFDPRLNRGEFVFASFHTVPPQ
jgi:hypothetical protein